MFNISMKTPLHHCPQCHSDELISLAGNFGHGDCCTE